MRLNRHRGSIFAVAAAVAGMVFTMAPPANASVHKLDCRSQDATVWHGGGIGHTRTGTVKIHATACFNGTGLTGVSATIYGNNNTQGSALGIRHQIHQPTVDSSSRQRWVLVGSDTLKACPPPYGACGFSATVTWTVSWPFIGPPSLSWRQSGNTNSWHFYNTP